MTNRLPWWITAAFLFVVAASLLGRAHLVETRPLAGRLNGQEPESHILTTEIAFEQTPWSTHHLLPLTSYGAPYNKYIDQHPGAQAPDALGNLYYASTPPLTFVIPYLASKLTGGPSLVALRWYNITLQAFAAALLAALIFRCTRGRDVSQEVRVLVSLAAAVMYMTAPECLKSHTITLWAQQIYCVLLLLQIWLVLFKPNLLLLFLSAVVGCLADWTPYIANTGMAALALYSFWKYRERRSLWVAAALLAGCVVGGLTLIYWYSTNCTVGEYFAALRDRSAARSEGGLFAFLHFIPTYLNSFGFFTLLALLGLAWRPWRGTPKINVPRSPVLLPRLDPLVVALAIFSVALLENLLVKEHALLYTYDRLKGIQCGALFLAWGALQGRSRARWYFGLSCGLGLLSLGLFVFSYEAPHGWARIAKSQQERIGAIIVKTASPKGPAFSTFEARGAEVYYAQRNLAHYTASVEQAREWLIRHQQSEGTFYELTGNYMNPSPAELPRTLRIWRVYPDQPAVELQAVPLDERAGDYHSDKSFGGIEPIWR